MKGEQHAIPLVIAILATFALLVARYMLLRALRLRTGENPVLVRIFISSFRLVSVFWCIGLGFYAGIRFSELPERYAFGVNKIIYILLVLSITAVLAGLSGKLFKYYVEKAGVPVPTTGLTYGLIVGIIYILGALIILHSLGVSISPLLTAMGIGGLAVALALRDTLANLFAGIQIILERPFSVGDFVGVHAGQPGQEGRVEDIGLRTTKLRLLSNNLMIIPNTVLTQNVITNYSLPQKEMVIRVPFTVSYDSDPEHVEKLLVEEALKGIGAIPGLLAQPAPYSLMTGFTENLLSFNLICAVGRFVNQYEVEDALRKRVLKRFRTEGIEIHPK